MTKADVANEPSMEDILASIRKIIAEEPLTFPPAGKRVEQDSDIDGSLSASHESDGNQVSSQESAVAPFEIGKFGQNVSGQSAMTGGPASPMDDLADLIDDARSLNPSEPSSPQSTSVPAASALPTQPTHGFFASRGQRTVKREGFISTQSRIEPSLGASDTDSSQNPTWATVAAGPSLSFDQAFDQALFDMPSGDRTAGDTTGGAAKPLGDALPELEELRNFPRDFGTIVPNRMGPQTQQIFASPYYLSSLAEAEVMQTTSGLGSATPGMSAGALDGGRLIAEVIKPVAIEPVVKTARTMEPQASELPGSLMDEIKRNAEASAPLKASLKAEVERATDIFKQTTAASAAASARGETGPAAGGTTLEDIVAVLMKPLLKSWIDENMPRMIENALRNEIAATLGQTGSQSTGSSTGHSTGQSTGQSAGLNSGIKRD